MCQTADVAGCPDLLERVGRLVHAHRGRLSAVARSEGLPPEDALDAVQEAFVTFLGRPGACAQVDPPEQALHVLAAITRNTARNGRRRRHLAAPHLHDDRELEALVDSASPSADERLDAELERQRLAGCVGQLGELQQRVVTLRLLDEVAGEDVAQTLGLTPGHVAVLLHRAKHNLRSCMG